MNEIVSSYLNFKEYDNSKIINNSDAFIDKINFSEVYINLDKNYERIDVDYNDFEKMEDSFNETYNLSIKKMNYFYDVINNKLGYYLHKLEKALIQI